jgi:hypothetical protein
VAFDKQLKKNMTRVVQKVADLCTTRKLYSVIGMKGGKYSY